ncbi:subtilisin-like protease [Impatiens glandulifera]|uniref:subtilisin-like protease n=1 Tax=Impatiens glandulifera TaxID=253017 RepID=UPI001FB0E48C|nr:subtilisin-like protease [Impatiens glandulifera]
MAFIFILVLLSMFNFVISQKDDSNTHKTYIVQLSLPGDSLSEDQIQTFYHSFLPSSTTSVVTKSRMIHSYRHVMHGFAASLTPQEAMEMEKRNEVISIRPQRIIPLQTTHTPSFLGLNPNFGAWPGSNFGKGVIIGVLDTGITPNHPAFNDDGLSSPPRKWKGKCELNGTVCNKKLIGARNFLSKMPGEPIDDFGHGTHTASTAAGNIVFGANVFGQASGTAAGIAPLSHLAIYRVCWWHCSDSDILAGMDAAIEDGVDVMSLSLGHDYLSPFYEDAIAIGAYAAITKGIFVSCAAGNSGPTKSTMSNEAPWILTVGASTIDRTIKAKAVLGNQLEFDGESIFQPKNFKSMQIPLIFAGFKHKKSSFCAPGTLNKSDFKGKIVLCQERGDGPTVRDAGGVAMILANSENSGYTIEADIHVLPATAVSYAAGVKIMDYINSTHNPTATIVFKGTVIGDKTAPAVASFSSRGPNRASPGILKPDIIGPGNNILAAWNVPFDKMNSVSDLKSNFNFDSGTSMATPHLSGIAALIKSAHPDWSPAAIKSAMMTTADLVNLGGTPILNEKHLPADIFAVGAGHVNPSKAIDPGLIYDLTAEDYVPYLCGLNYTNNKIEAITKQSVDCSIVGSISEAELNYPTFAVTLCGSSNRYKRTVTNVGPRNSKYKVRIEITGVSIEVVPKTLHFKEAGQKLTYEVIFKNKKSTDDEGATPSFVEGSLIWNSLHSKHVVRNRISVKL